MTHDVLNNFLVHAQLIQIRRNPTPEPMPANTNLFWYLHNWTDDSLGKLVEVHRHPISEVKHHSRFGIAHRTPMCIQDVSQLPNHRNRRGTGTRLRSIYDILPD